MRHGPLLVALLLAGTWLAVVAGGGSAAVAAESAGTGAPSAADGKRVVLLRFRGPGADLVRGATMGTLEDQATLELVPVRLLESQRNLTGTAGERAVELARRLALTALVRGRVTRVGRAVRATLTVVSGRDGRVVGSVVFNGENLLDLCARLRAQGGTRLLRLLAQSEVAGSDSGRGVSSAGDARATTTGEADTSADADGDADAETDMDADPDASPPLARRGTVNGSEAPASPEAPPASAPQAQRAYPPLSRAAPLAPASGAKAFDDEGEARRRAARPPGAASGASVGRGISPGDATARCSIFELEVAGGGMMRVFNYRDEERGALRGYLLRRAPVARLEATLFPFGAGRCGAAGVVGMRGSLEQMMPVTSRLADRPLDTDAFSFQGEVVLRFRAGPFILKPTAGYFARRFTVSGNVVPNVAYQGVGAGFEAELRRGSFLAEVGVGARWVLAAGEIGDATWFPGATTTMFAARARVGWAVVRWLDVLVGAETDYATSSFNTDPGGAYPNGVAGGAYDLFVRAMMTLRLRQPAGGGEAP